MSQTVRITMAASAASPVSWGLVLDSAAGAADRRMTTFFVTSVGSGKGGDLGGLEGADASLPAAGAGRSGAPATARLSLHQREPGGESGRQRAYDRISKGPLEELKGTVMWRPASTISRSDNIKARQRTTRSPSAAPPSGSGMDRTGTTSHRSQADSRAFPSNMSLTCNNWTSSVTGYVAMLTWSHRPHRQQPRVQEVLELDACRWLRRPT